MACVHLGGYGRNPQKKGTWSWPLNHRVSDRGVDRWRGVLAQRQRGTWSQTYACARCPKCWAGQKAEKEAGHIRGSSVPCLACYLLGGHLVIIQQVVNRLLLLLSTWMKMLTIQKRTSRRLLSVGCHPDHPFPTYRESRPSKGQWQLWPLVPTSLDKRATLHQLVRSWFLMQHISLTPAHMPPFLYD